MNQQGETQTGTILDDSVEFSLVELCRTCRVQSDVVIQLVEVGALEPRGRAPAQWRFSGHAVLRVERALNLQRDLDVNLAGAALALELLDEIEQLRERLRMFEGE